MYPVHTNDLLYADDSDAFQFGEKGELAARRAADLMELSKTDVECLDETLDHYRRTNHRQWRAGVMDWTWRDATYHGALFRDGHRHDVHRVPLLGVILGLPNAENIIRNIYVTGTGSLDDPPEPATLGEALKQIGRWGEIIGGCIERGEPIPPEALFVSLRELTAAAVGGAGGGGVG
jgi:hypothetical protein